MALRHWDPFRDVSFIQEQMNQLFQDTLRKSCPGSEALDQGSWMPPVDIYETEEAIILTAELPGVDPTHITIEVRENTLTLCGERRHKHEIKEENYHRIERAYGSFQRAFTLPSAVNHSQVKATYRDGVLEITLPKAERVKARQVKIAID